MMDEIRKFINTQINLAFDENSNLALSSMHTIVQSHLLLQIYDRLEGNTAKPEMDTQKRRLIVSLDALRDSTASIDAREQAFKRIFKERFPDAPKFSPNKWARVFSDRKYWIVGIEQKHADWAKAACDCGLIDTYIVDYAPDEEIVTT